MYTTTSAILTCGLLALTGCSRFHSQENASAQPAVLLAPAQHFDLYLIGFHPMKDDPSVQMSAHHYCNHVNPDMLQCVLFDGNTSAAKMIGVEYIIPEATYNTLPAGEKHYWHPHNYEILSGQLIAPGLPPDQEKNLMKAKLNSYGKTWHVWMVAADGNPGDPVPMGDPHLAWSLNHDGEAKAGLVDQRDQTLGVNTTEIHKSRQDLVPLAHPQSGVDDLSGKFAGATLPIPGVTDTATAAGNPGK